MRQKMRYLPGFVDVICFKFFNIGNFSVDINPQNGHNSGQKWVPRHDSGGIRRENLMRNKMGYPPRFIEIIYFKLFNIGELTADTKTQNCHNWGPMGSP